MPYAPDPSRPVGEMHCNWHPSAPTALAPEAAEPDPFVVNRRAMARQQAHLLGGQSAAAKRAQRLDFERLQTGRYEAQTTLRYNADSRTVVPLGLGPDAGVLVQPGDVVELSDIEQIGELWTLGSIEAVDE